MLKNFALSVEFLGSLAAAGALLRLSFWRLRTHRQFLFGAFLFAMAAFCLSNAGFAIIVGNADSSTVGFDSMFARVCESIQLLIFLYATPILVTAVVVVNVLARRTSVRKIGVPQ